MARKTNNSSGSLAHFMPEAFDIDSQRKKKQGGMHSVASRNKVGKSRKQKLSKRSHAVQASSEDEAEADGETDATDNEEADDQGDDDVKEAALAPSATVTKNHGKQAGRSNHADDDEMEVRGRTRSRRRNISASESEHGRKSPSRSVNPDGTSHRDLINAADDDDDDDYTGVAMISDSDEIGDPNVLKSEEQNIIKSMRASKHKVSPVATSLLEDTDAGWDTMDIPDDSLLTDMAFFDEQIGRTEPSVFSGEMETMSSTSVFEGFSPPPTNAPSPRRVRFMTPIRPASESSDVSSNDGGDLNVLFTAGEDSSQQVNNDSGMEMDGDNEDGEDEGSSCGSSSGYETDYGETTDEEDAPADALTKPHALLRQPDAYSSHAPVLMQGEFKVPAIPASLRRGPRMGTFTIDSKKPVAVVDSTGENMVIYPATRPAPVKTSLARIPSGNNSSTPATPITPHATLGSAADLSDTDYTDMASQISVDPVLSAAPNFASAGFPDPAPTVPLRVDPPTSSSVFLPMDSIEDPANYLIDDDEDDLDEAEQNLELDDFIDWGDGSSEDEGANASAASPTSASGAESKDKLLSKTSPSSASSAQDYFKDFDTGLITAFRRDQSRMHHAQRRPHHGLSLSMSAMKTGRHGTSAAFPLPQSKKRKLSDDFRPSMGLEMTAKRRVLNHP